MQSPTSSGPLHTLTLSGRLLRSRRIDVFPDRVEVERRRPYGSARRVTIALVAGLRAAVAPDWRLVGHPWPPGSARSRTYAVEHGLRLVVAGIRSRSDAERIARAINSVTRRDGGGAGN